MQQAAIQSPTTIFPKDISPLPREHMQRVAAYVETSLDGDIGRLRQQFASVTSRSKRSVLPVELQQDIGRSVAFLFTILPPEESARATVQTVRDIAKDNQMRQNLTNPHLVGTLNRDLVEYFLAHRKDDTPDFRERIQEYLANLNPLRWLRPPVKPAAATPELATLANDRDEKLLGVTQRYLRRLMAHPEKLDHPALGQGREDILTHLLPKLVERLYDDAFLKQLDDATRKLFLTGRDAIAAAFARNLDTHTLELITKPDAFDLRITGHHAGKLHLGQKTFENPEGYKTAIGQEIIIDVAQQEQAKAAPDIVMRGTGYYVDHTHWHLAEPEHRIDGDQRELKGEVHIVHKTKKGDKALVLGAYIEVVDGVAPNPLVDAIITQAKQPAEVTPQTPTASQPEASFSHLDFLPQEAWEKTTYHTYRGTLTTAPYSDGVDFCLAKETVRIPPQQYQELYQLMQVEDGHSNSRDAQPYRDRAVTEIRASFERGL